VDPSRVLVTSGSQQALDLLARTLCAPGATVVVEEPAYLGALQALCAAGAVPHPVPLDEDGLDVDELARRLAGGLRPALVYTVTTFQNPSGAVLAPARRVQLAELAARYGFTVVEDDPYAEIRFGIPPVPPVRATNDADVVTLGSFSKTVAPGVRVGWAVLPEPLVGPLTRLKQAADLQTGSLGQAVVARLVADRPWWEHHLDEVRAVYAERAAALADALGAAFGDRLALGSPRGGMFLWGRFTDGTPTSALLPVALAHGVGFVPGEEFFSGPDPDRSSLRLSFATNGPAGLAEAARRLAAAHAELDRPVQVLGSRSASS
jgi:2-aminoadipate transaminase